MERRNHRRLRTTDHFPTAPHIQNRLRSVIPNRILRGQKVHAIESQPLAKLRPVAHRRLRLPLMIKKGYNYFLYLR